MEDASLQDAIGCLVQTILASLLIGSKLAVWIGKVGLAHDIERLRSQIEQVKTVVSAVKGRAIRSKLLDQSLAPLKDLLSDANDVLSKLDYWRLQGGLEPDGHGEPQDVNAGLPSSSVRKLLSDDPSSSTGDGDATPVATVGNSSTRKRRRDEESTHVTAADTSPWNKDEFSNRIQEITRQLQGVQGDVKGVLLILGSDNDASFVQRKVYGRSAEKASIIKLIKKHKTASGVAVLPIVGIAGVGKTALAQLIFNDPSVGSQFDHRIWLSVSDNFDKMRLSAQMLAFTQVQEVLKGHIKSKRVLLVLDDVWNDMDDCRWNNLLASFSSDNARGNFILLTTRKLSVARTRGTTGSIELDALEDDDIWPLLKACAYDDDKYEDQASLNDLGQQIAHKLKGNPLAAETAGILLRKHLTVYHWSNILKNEDWKSLELSSGIMPTLKLSYDELPYHLKQCFSYCSIFPYRYHFLSEELVHMWISQGFVKCNHSSQRLEEIGRSYLTDLVSRGFFQQVQKDGQTCYALCGLMHDLARVVSRTECATMDGLQYNVMLPTALHLSILTNSVYQRKDQTGLTPRCEKFEEKLRYAVTSVRKLRTLVLIGQYDSFFFKAFQDVFQKAHNLRLLQMSASFTDFHSFISSLVNPTHLRYLKLDGHVGQGASPQVLGNLFHLQTLDVCLHTDPIIRRSGDWLTLAQTVYLEDCAGWEVLSCLEKLPFLARLKLSNMLKIREVSVRSLEELILVEMPDLQRCSCTSMRDLKSNLRILMIKSCPILKVFDLFEKGHNIEIEQKSWLPGLRKLTIVDCPNLQILVPLPPSATFSELLIRGVETLPKMKASSSKTLEIAYCYEMMALDDKILAFHNLRNVKHLKIFYCRTSISFKDLSQLKSLESLTISYCTELFSSDGAPEYTHEDTITPNCTALPSLIILSIVRCEISGKWLSLMLRHAPNLKELSLEDCPQFTLLRIEEDENIESSRMSDSSSEASSSGFQDDLLTKLGIGDEVNTKSNLISAPEDEIILSNPISALNDSLSGCRDYSSASSSLDGLWRIPFYLASSLKKIKIESRSVVRFDGRSEGFAVCTSLENLTIMGFQPRNVGEANERWLLPQSLEQLDIHKYPHETLWPCFAGDVTCLKELKVRDSPILKSLQLHSCTAMEDLEIINCDSLPAIKGIQSLKHLKVESDLKSLQLDSCTAMDSLMIYCRPLVTLEGFRSLVNLKHLEVVRSPAALASLTDEIFPELESLEIGDLSLLTTSFCKGLTCLRSLKLINSTAKRLTDEQARALLLLRSLEELQFVFCDLVQLPAGLHGLPSLKKLKINGCEHISRLPNNGLPPSLEELEIRVRSDELSEQCRLLATSKLEVKINRVFPAKINKLIGSM